MIVWGTDYVTFLVFSSSLTFIQTDNNLGSQLLKLDVELIVNFQNGLIVVSLQIIAVYWLLHMLTIIALTAEHKDLDQTEATFPKLIDSVGGGGALLTF